MATVQIVHSRAVNTVTYTARLPVFYVAHELSCGHYLSNLPVLTTDDVECERCDRDAEAWKQINEAHERGEIAHTRAGDRLMRDSILVYARRQDSPTGVWLLTTVPHTDASVARLRAMGIGSPLSPTEGRGR